MTQKQHKAPHRKLFILYAAKSTKDTNDSVESQIDEMREHVEAEGGEIVGQPFKEEAVSGYKQSRGPELIAAQKLAADTAAANPDADVVLLAFDANRFARGDGKQAKHLVQYFLEAQEAGYRLAAIDEDLDDIVKVAVLGQTANKDSKAKSRAITRGAKHRAKRGDYHGGSPPYGYKWSAAPVRQVTNSKGEVKLVRQLVHDRAEAAIVRRIFRERDAGKRQTRIARDLHREKVPARRTKWRQPTVGGILTNPTYVGWVRFKGEVVRDERGQPIRGSHKPIIDLDTYLAVQEHLDAEKRLKGGGRGRPPKGNRHLFTRGMLRCGRCGGPMVPHGITDVYFCFNRVHDPEACDMPRVKRADIDDPSLAFFADKVLDVEATMAQLQATEDARRGEVAAQRERAERDQLDLAGERARADRDYRKGDLPAKRYDALCAKIEEEQAAAAAQVEKLRAREQELSSESILASIDADTAEWLAETHAGIMERFRGAGDIDELRAKLLTRFDRFVLHRSEVTRRLVPGAEQPLDRLNAGTDYYIEPFVRPEAWPDMLLGFDIVQEGEDEWHAPVMRRVPLALRANNQSSSSPSQ